MTIQLFCILVKKENNWIDLEIHNSKDFSSNLYSKNVIVIVSSREKEILMYIVSEKLPYSLVIVISHIGYIQMTKTCYLLLIGST